MRGRKTFGVHATNNPDRNTLKKLFLALGLALAAANGSAAAELVFQVRRDAAEPETLGEGRLYVFVSKQARPEPRTGPNWFRPEPFFGRDVQSWKAGETVELGDQADGFPSKASELPAGDYHVQAVFDRCLDHADHNQPGNWFSDVVAWRRDPAQPQRLELRLTQVAPEAKRRDGENYKFVRIKSELLSKHHGRDVFEGAGVILPSSYQAEPQRRYPVIYIVTGFSGDHLTMGGAAPPAGPGEVEFIRVILDGQCQWGHHVYADSATNGPRGKALVQEMIPHIDRTFRTVAAPTARFLNGHSSGGWSSLWLQVTYPADFHGVWSTAPDPVDFRDFQRIDLYAQPPVNMYVDPAGERRPLARMNGRVVLWYDSFCRMDDVIGRGGQLRSFEAVFSPLDSSGQPRRLWNRTTGAVDPVTAKAWEAYDIRLTIERNWERLRPKLAGKLHIAMGDQDTFYLEGSTRLLASTLKQLGSDAEVTLVPSADHFNLTTPSLNAQSRKQMSAVFLKAHPEASSSVELERK